MALHWKISVTLMKLALQWADAMQSSLMSFKIRVVLGGSYGQEAL
jgi:hypothetical protein